MTVHQLPRKYSHSPQKHAKKPFVAPVDTMMALYTVTRLDGSYCVTTVQGGRVQMRGNKRACEDWIVSNTFVEENA